MKILKTQSITRTNQKVTNGGFCSGHMIDLTGQKFGKLMVLGKTDIRKNGYIVYACLCDCGSQIFVPSRLLKQRIKTSCGCEKRRHPSFQNLTGIKFGKLSVVSEAGKTDKGAILWNCLCECGGTVVAETSELTSGNRKSCGCLSKYKELDWIGKQFGELTVVKHEHYENGNHWWRCQCTCGNEAIVKQRSLSSGRTRSCGCRKKENLVSSRHFIEGTCIEAIRQKIPNKANTSGIRGVHYAEKSGRWCAQITFKRKCYTLGYYKTLEEAAEVRKKAEEITFDRLLKAFDDREDIPVDSPETIEAAMKKIKEEAYARRKDFSDLK